jgi:sugar phosphate isomerase/epimerase
VIADCGLELVGLSAVRCSVIDPIRGPENLKRVLRSIDAAARLGASVVSIGFHRPLTPEQQRGPFWMIPGPTDSREESNWETAITRVRLVADHAAERGIEISLEMHEGTLIDSASGLLRIIDGVGRPNLGINPDLGNLIRVPHRLAEPWRDTFVKIVAYVNYWHVKNYIRMEDPERGIVMSSPSALDAGEIDYRWALERALQSGYRGPICVEHYSGDALWVMEQGRRYLEAVLGRLGSPR